MQWSQGLSWPIGIACDTAGTKLATATVQPTIEPSNLRLDSMADTAGLGRAFSGTRLIGLIVDGRWTPVNLQERKRPTFVFSQNKAYVKTSE